jgi:hypothetical protein
MIQHGEPSLFPGSGSDRQRQVERTGNRLT